MRWAAAVAVLIATPLTQPPLRLQDEGVTVGQVDTLNFVGATIACARLGSRGTCTVSAGGGTGSPGGLSGNIQVNDGAGGFGAYPGTSCAYAVKTLDASGASTCTAAPSIPADLSAEPFITKIASGNLSGEFALGSLPTGILKNTTVTGVPTIAASGTDYAPATSGSVILLGNGAGGFSNYAGATSCTNQFFTGLSSAGASTCTTDVLASAQHPNQGTTTTLLHGNAAGNPAWTGVALADFVANLGTTTTVLHGNAAGQPSFAAVSLTADVTGILPLANGGTNANLTADNGAIPYSSASAFALLAHGTAGQALFSGGAGAPTWGSAWQFLGTATGATVTVGPITWTATTRYVMCSYQIIGYNGGTPVGRFLMGTASISTTARTNSYAISEGVTAPTTAAGATATPGIPLAVTLSNVGRMGSIFIDGQSGSVKTINVLGQNQTPAVATVPTIFQGASFFSDLGTNLAITRAQLTVYDTLTAIAASAQTFTSGTRLTCWGRDIT